MQKILVTGGTGYIGSHTAVALIEKGYEVVIIDNLSNSRAEVIESISGITGKKPSFHQIDLCDAGKLRKFFESEKVDAVIHFAARKLVEESVQKPVLYYRNNLVSLINLAESCLEFEVKHIVFSSSCTVYGQPDTLPVDESALLKKAESPYGNTKRISEEILADVTKISSLQVISLRYFNPVGAHESTLIGEYPLNAPSNLMPVITSVAIGKRKSLQVFGNDYDTPDGTCIRDYIHVMDVADAHVIAIVRLLDRRNPEQFEVFNLGTGKGITVLEMIRTFERVNKLSLNYSIVNRRAGDVVKIFAGTRKINEVLGWKTSRTLEDMVSSAWKWEQRLADMEKETTGR